MFPGTSGCAMPSPSGTGRKTNTPALSPIPTGALNTGVTPSSTCAQHSLLGPRRRGGRRSRGVGSPGRLRLRSSEAGEWDQQWLDDLGPGSRAMASQIGRMLTLRMAQRCFSQVDNLTAERIEIARGLGIGMTVDPVAWDESTERVLDLAGAAGFLGPDLDFVHCSDLSDEAWKAMGEAGVKVSVPLRRRVARLRHTCRASPHGAEASMSGSPRASAWTSRPPCPARSSPRCARCSPCNDAAPPWAILPGRPQLGT